MADARLDAKFGVPIPSGSGIPENKPVGALDFEALGAKAYQAATFGFGADLDRVLFGKQAEQATRALSNAYDAQHPMAGFAVDLAIGAIESSARAVKGVSSGLRALASGAAVGGATGAASGFGAGGDFATRTSNAITGGVEGAVTALVLGGAGKALERLAPGLFSQTKIAADKIKRTLAAAGWTPDKAQAYLQKNPGARLVDLPDVGPKIGDLMAKASSQSNDTARQLGEALREDVGAQGSRLANSRMKPLARTRQQLLDDAKDLSIDKNNAYAAAKAGITPMSPELSKALDHPDVKPLVDDVLASYQKARLNPNSPEASALKYKAGKELPTSVIDELQRRVRALESETPVGLDRGSLQHAQSLLRNAQPQELSAAQRLAAKLGGVDSETGILGAQQWGHQYAFGMKAAPIERFEQMSPLEQQYARLGMVDGFQKYLDEHTRLPTGTLDRLADQIGDPKIATVLGKRTANQVKNAFREEAARAKRNTEMARGGARNVAFEENVGEATASHIGNVVLGRGLGSIARFAAAKGMSEKQARALLDIGMKAGDPSRLSRAAEDRKLLDRMREEMGIKGLVSGRIAAHGQSQVEGDD